MELLHITICLSVAIAVLYAHDCQLSRQVKKIGCFHDSNHDMEELINGHSQIDWDNFGASTEGLICDCIKKAHSKGYDYIQIGYFGHCSGGKNFEEALAHRKKNPSVECVNIHYNMCADDSKHHCVGTDVTGYIYQITGGPININGGYSTWSRWTECSVTCGEGVQNRGRQCVNPVPKGDGRDCQHLGAMTESKSCKRKACIGTFLGDVSLVSKNYPHYKLGTNANHEGFIITASKQEFKMVTGFYDGTVSFKTHDNRYLRHRSWLVHFDHNDESELFKKDASYFLKHNQFFHGYVSLESYNYRGAYLRHQGYRIKLHYSDHSALYKNDASFLLIKGEDKFRGIGALVSQNYPAYSIGARSNNEAFIIHGHHKFTMVPGLNGRSNTVSFMINGRYLRHRYGLCHFDVNDHTQLFKDDASFVIHEDKYFKGYVSLEASNYPNAFLRHQGYRMKLHYSDGSMLYKKDASFLLVRTKS